MPRSVGIRLAALLAACAIIALLVGGCRERPFEAGELGAVEVGPGEPVELAVMLSFSGAPAFGEPIAKAIRLAIEDYGDVHGHPVLIADSLDSACSPDGGRRAARRAITAPQTVGVIGTTCSSAAIEASPLISAAGMVMISGLNTAAALTSDLAGRRGADNFAGYLRVSNNDLDNARAVARFIYEELNLSRVATVHDGDAYTSALAAGFTAAFAELGGQTVLAERISKGDTDMSRVLGAMAAADPEAVFFPLFPDEAAHLIQQARSVAAFDDVEFIGSDAVSVLRFLALAEAEGVYIAGAAFDWGDNTNSSTGKSVREAHDAYAARWGPPQSGYWQQAYDAATLLLSTIESVAVVRGDTIYIDRSALRQALHATVGFAGLTGSLSCDEFGDCGPGLVLVYHHTDSGITDIGQLPVVYRSVRE